MAGRHSAYPSISAPTSHTKLVPSIPDPFEIEPTRNVGAPLISPSPHRTKMRFRLTLNFAGLTLLCGFFVDFGWIGASSVSAQVESARPHSAADRATFLGRTGVEARWMLNENQRRGTASWQIRPGTPENQIAGFSNLNYARVGDAANLYVSTRSPTFTVTAYRMGWYHGLGARAVWTSREIARQVQPACPLTPGVNMVSCANWTMSLTMRITKEFVQGDYLLKLTGSGGDEGYIPLTVWDPKSRAAYVIVNRTFTEAGWNSYGGYSFYAGTGPCPAGSSTYPVCNRARIASLDRPFDTGYGASDFLSNEYPLIQYGERHGLDMTYVTDLTLTEHPELALVHKAILSLGHDETWSYIERQAVLNAKSQGVNLAFFGAAAVLRHVRLEASPLGPDRLVVDYRDASEDPLNGAGDPTQVTGNTFASPPTNLPPETLTGELYSGYLNGAASVPFVVTDATSWAFRGTGLKAGAQLAGVVMSDVDHLGDSALTPQNIQVLGHSPIPQALAYTNEGTWGGETYSDMTYYTDPVSRAGVLDTGTVNWINAMNPCPPAVSDCSARQVQAITGNVLRQFGQGPAGLTAPSVANWQTVVPAGS